MTDMRRRRPEPPPGPPQIELKPGLADETLRELAPLLARERAVVTLRLVTEAIADGDTRLAAAILEQAQPESADNTTPTVSGCIGVALGLLDDWLTSNDLQAPHGLAHRARLPAGHWTGERAATDILVLARKGRAFRSLDTLIARQGGKHVLYGSALALAAVMKAWSLDTGTGLRPRALNSAPNPVASPNEE
jgi:hypothetical protein